MNQTKTHTAAGAQRILNAFAQKSGKDTTGVDFINDSLNMKNVSYLRACEVLSNLKVTEYKDAGAFDFHKGTHPELGELILVVNAVDGSAMLIQ